VWGQRLSALTQSQREEIWLRRDEGATLDQLARRFGVSIATISRACSDRRQRTNLKTVPDEIPQIEKGSEQPQEQPRQGSTSEKVLLAEGRKRKPGRSASQATGH
jgi:DNA-directed RNA polymerase specialized sigma24 family protein